jgi:hypothetical protein
VPASAYRIAKTLNGEGTLMRYAERIALEGTNWINLRFVTPLDIALRMGAPFLVERGVHPSEISSYISVVILECPPAVHQHRTS